MTYLSSALENLLFVCLLGAILGKVYGEIGVWTAFVLAEILTLASFFIIIALRKKSMPRTIDDFLCLSSDFQRGKIWGFGDGQKHSIDIFIDNGKSLTLRIRDDCVPFDPMEWLKIHQDDYKLKNIGIRTICSLATEARYSRTLGLNYLFLRW